LRVEEEGQFQFHSNENMKYKIIIRMMRKRITLWEEMNGYAKAIY
jgi:hypothetical protein